MKVIVTTRDTLELGEPVVFDGDLAVTIDRGILTVKNWVSGSVTEFNSGFWNSVTYGGDTR